MENKMAYIFTLKYLLAEDDRDLDALLERLGEEGCDDALVGVGLPGRIALEFTREASNAHDALCSALADTTRALPGARLIEAAPDYVGLSDAAELLRMSRQNMRKLMLAHSATFPVPFHEGTTSLWHLLDVLEWLIEKGGYAVPTGIVDVARATLSINAEKLRARV
jgi:hypothetical protein